VSAEPHSWAAQPLSPCFGGGWFPYCMKNTAALAARKTSSALPASTFGVVGLDRFKTTPQGSGRTAVKRA